MTIAEESTSWPGVSQPVYAGGLGFGFKWNMGWMHDTLDYMAREPVHRSYHHDEHHLRPALRLHRELRAAAVATTKWCTAKARCSRKMPGDDWQKFANLRAYYGFMWGYPGKKLLFMGQEFAPARASGTRHAASTGSCSTPAHEGVQAAGRATSTASTASTPALHARDCEGEGFDWLDRRRRRAIRCSPGCARRAGRRRRSRRLQLHAGAARRLPRGAAAAPGAGARSSTPTPPIYGGSGMGNLGERRRPGEPMARLAGIRRRSTLPPLATLLTSVREG